MGNTLNMKEANFNQQLQLLLGVVLVLAGGHFPLSSPPLLSFLLFSLDSLSLSSECGCSNVRGGAV